MGRLPNFFIVGAPKAGTTALYTYLDQHPQVYLSPVKETNYFASELRPENFRAADRLRILREMRELQEYLDGDMGEKRFGGIVATWEDYQKLFRKVSREIAVGEATPCYLWSRTAARNIAARVPQAKIIVSLRNPADRAFSQYLHMVTVGAVRKPFGALIKASLRGNHTHFGPTWPFLEFGQYCAQVERYLQEFPKSQIHISLYEDLERAPENLMSRLFAFLDVDPNFTADLSGRFLEPRVPKLATTAYLLKKWRIWSPLQKLMPPAWRERLRTQFFRSRSSLSADPADYATLVAYYRDDVDRLASLIDRDLSSWLRPRESG